MRVPRLYVDQALCSGANIDLDSDASRYLGGVLRMEAGRALQIFNGEGGVYDAIVHSASKKQVSVSLQDFHPDNRESPLAVHLGIALSKGDRFDWVIQKATELGVSQITPLFTSRAEIRLNSERQDKKVSHWQQIAISACEQCQRNLVPPINTPAKLDDWLAARTEDLKLVLHHHGNKKLKQHAMPKSVVLLVGPEGGLDDAEVTNALTNGFEQLTLGPRVFRTETAPIVGLSLLQYEWGDF